MTDLLLIAIPLALPHSLSDERFTREGAPGHRATNQCRLICYCTAHAHAFTDARLNAIRRLSLSDWLIDVLVSASQDDDPQIRIRAVQMLGECKTDRSVRVLANVIKADKSIEVKKAAVNSLGNIGKTLRSAVPILIQALKNNQTYSELDQLEDRGFSADTLNDEAAIALNKIGPDAVGPLSDVALDRSCKPAVRLLAIKALMYVNKLSPPAEKCLIQLTTDKESKIRLEAVIGLERADPGSIEAKRGILGALADSSPYIQVVAAGTLHSLDTDNVISVPVLMHHLSTTKDLMTRWRAITELGYMGDKSSAAIPVLIPLVRSADSIIRLAAVRALGRIGPKAKIAIPVLMEAMNDKDKSVAEFAEDSIKLIEMKK
ncbi:MAG: repeat-containing protein [Gemmataceae bacterium]|nr:repeat-containing protein [Gemmataceae bacterium]